MTPTDIATLATGLSLPFARIVSMAGFVSDKQDQDIQERIAALIKTIPMLESQLAAADFLTPDDLEAMVTYLEALQYRVKSST